MKGGKKFKKGRSKFGCWMVGCVGGGMSKR